MRRIVLPTMLLGRYPTLVHHTYPPWYPGYTVYIPPSLLYGHAAASSSVHGGEVPGLRTGERDGWEAPCPFWSSFLLWLLWR